VVRQQARKLQVFPSFGAIVRIEFRVNQILTKVGIGVYLTGGYIPVCDEGSVMAYILEEHFENTGTPGYDVAGWSETITAGNTVDENANSSDCGSPSGWGSDCLKIICAADNTSAYADKDLGAAKVITYWHLEFYITSMTADTATLLSVWSDAWTNGIFLQFATSGGNTKLALNCCWDGDSHTYQSFNNLSLNTVYKVDIKWDVTNHAWSWKLDGVVQANNVDATAPVTSEGTMSGAHPADLRNLSIGTFAWGASSTATTYYVDNVIVDDTTWVSVSTDFSITTRVPIHQHIAQKPKEWLGITRSVKTPLHQHIAKKPIEWLGITRTVKVPLHQHIAKRPIEWLGIPVQIRNALHQHITVVIGLSVQLGMIIATALNSIHQHIVAKPGLTLSACWISVKSGIHQHIAPKIRWFYSLMWIFNKKPGRGPGADPPG
jgi:hypothetical protein